MEDFYLDTRGTKYTLICAAKQLPNAFKQLFIKQLMKQDAIMVEKESELFDEKSKLCIWDKDMFSKESLYQYILQKSMQDSHSHYIFFEMSESHLAVQPFWQLEDKRILWIGEMLDRYSYEMCLEVGAIRLKHNQGTVSYTHLDVYKRQYLLYVPSCVRNCKNMMNIWHGRSENFLMKARLLHGMKSDIANMKKGIMKK